jgi:hypothetical protein
VATAHQPLRLASGYAVLLGKATGFAAVWLLTVPAVLQFVVYGYALYRANTIKQAAAKATLLLLLHFFAFAICTKVW